MLLSERIRNDRVDELIAHLDMFLHFISPKLSEAPGRPVVATLDGGNLRFHDSTKKPISWMVQNRGIPAQWGRRWVGYARRGRADVFTKKKLGRGVERETRRDVLKVDRVPVPQARLHLVSRVLGVFLEDVKVADAIFGEERPCHVR